MGVKGDAQAKRLASQFIARFFSNFPSLAVESFEAMIDLCEDTDVNIRKQAIKVWREWNNDCLTVKTLA